MKLIKWLTTWGVAILMFFLLGYGMYKHAECRGLYSWSPQPPGQVCE